jgi:hypothetical protein
MGHHPQHQSDCPSRMHTKGEDRKKSDCLVCPRPHCLFVGRHPASTRRPSDAGSGGRLPTLSNKSRGPGRPTLLSIICLCICIALPSVVVWWKISFLFFSFCYRAPYAHPPTRQNLGRRPMRCIFRQVDARGRHNHVSLSLSPSPSPSLCTRQGHHEMCWSGSGVLAGGWCSPPFGMLSPLLVMSRATTVVQVGFCQGYPVDFFPSRGRWT